MAAPQVYTWVVEAGGALIGTFPTATAAGAYIVANLGTLSSPTIRPILTTSPGTVPR